MARRDRTKEIDTPPMFQVEAVHQSVGENGRYKPQGITAWCPGCRKEEAVKNMQHPRAVGLVSQGGHYVYRMHSRKNDAGQEHLCPCSGARLCDYPPIILTHGLERVEVCLCGKSNI